MEKNSKIFKTRRRRLTSILRRGVWSRAHIILKIREEDDFDQNDDDEFASFWKERCFFCSWSDESEELY